MPEDECPFCAGREDRTPPETLRIGDPWRVRVFPNLYPAFKRQEVVVHVPDHRTSFGQLDDEEAGLVARAWRERARAARADGFDYLHALVNEGREAGASRAHTHSQLVWLREPPPAVTAERAEGIAEILALSDVLVRTGGGLAVAAHPAPRGPYELLIAPVNREADAFESDLLAPALAELAAAARALGDLHPGVAWNAWLHDGPWWHLELLPRLTTPAGIELGAGISISTAAPEATAAALRG